MTIKAPFQPRYGSNQVLTPAAASAAVTLDAQRINKQVHLANTGAAICYVRTYDSRNGAQTATTADFPVPSGAARTISKAEGHDALAHISATGTTLQVMLGDGYAPN